MEIVVPRATTLPGLISRARTYRIVLNPSGLWIIHLGNAMGPPPPNHPIGKLVGIYLKRVKARLEKALAKKEQEIQSTPLPDLIESSRHSFHIPLSQRCVMKAETSTQASPSLHIKSPQGKITLHATESDRQALADISEMYDQNIERS